MSARISPRNSCPAEQALGIDHSKPWVLSSSELLTAALASKNLAACLIQWNRAYPKTLLFKEHDVVTSPLSDSQGLGDLTAFFAKVLPASRLVSNRLPAFQNATSAVKLFGESNVYSSFDFEKMFLASLRVQVSGVSKFLLMPATVLINVTGGKEGSGTTSLNDLVEKVKFLNGPDLQGMVERSKLVHHVELGPNQTLFTPSGWLVAQASFNNTDCVAIKKACFTNEKRAVQAIKDNTVVHVFRVGHEVATVRRESPARLLEVWICIFEK